MKLCKDCIHSHPGPAYPKCLHDANVKIDFYSGEKCTLHTLNYCREQYGHCYEAKHFESIDDRNRNTEREERRPISNHEMTEDQRLDDPRRG